MRNVEDRIRNMSQTKVRHQARNIIQYLIDNDQWKRVSDATWDPIRIQIWHNISDDVHTPIWDHIYGDKKRKDHEKYSL